MTWTEAIELLGAAPLLLFLLSGLMLALTGIVLMVFLGMWTYNDAKERTGEPILWTLLVLFVPIPIGIIAYLLLGRSSEGQSTGRYLKPLIGTVVAFTVMLVVLVGSAVHLLSWRSRG